MLLAMMTWDAPSKQIQRGCYAWQEWKYDVFVKPYLTDIENAGNDNADDELKIPNISENHLLFTNFTYLQDKFKNFIFTVRATSPSGTVNTIRISLKYILKLENIAHVIYLRYHRYHFIFRVRNHIPLSGLISISINVYSSHG